MYLRFTALLLILGISLGPARASDEPMLGVEGSDESIAARLRVAEHEFRKKWGGLTPEELAPGPVRPERNRALRIIEAVELFEASWDDPWSEAARPVFKDYSVAGAGEFATKHAAELARLEPALALLDTIDLLPESDFGIRYDRLFDTGPLRAARATYIFRMLTLSGLAELSEGHCGVATRRVELFLAMGEAFAGEPNGVMQIHRMHAGQQALALLRAVLSRCDLERKELERLSLLIDQDSRPPIEMMLFDNVLHLCRVFDSIEEETRASSDDDARLLAPSIAAAKLQAILFLDDWFEFATTARTFRGDPPVLSDLDVISVEEIEANLEPPESEDKIMGGETVIETDLGLAAILHIAFENFDGWLDRSDLWQTLFLLARTALALETYAKDHEGLYPEELDRLVPHYLGQTLLNPFTGEPLAYEAAADGYRLAAGEEAVSTWSHDVDPVLDWSRGSEGRQPGPDPPPEADDSVPSNDEGD